MYRRRSASVLAAELYDIPGGQLEPRSVNHIVGAWINELVAEASRVHARGRGFGSGGRILLPFSFLRLSLAA